MKSYKKGGLGGNIFYRYANFSLAVFWLSYFLLECTY